MTINFIQSKILIISVVIRYNLFVKETRRRIFWSFDLSYNDDLDAKKEKRSSDISVRHDSLFKSCRRSKENSTSVFPSPLAKIIVDSYSPFATEHDPVYDMIFFV